MMLYQIRLIEHEVTGWVYIGPGRECDVWLDNHEKYFVDGNVLVFPDRMSAFVMQDILTFEEDAELTTLWVESSK